MKEKILRLVKNQNFRDKSKVVLLIVWLIVIYFLSSLPGQGTPADFLTGVARKVAHFVEYAILMFIIFKVLRLIFKEVFSHALVIGIICSSIYALTDEFHQLYVLGRTGTIRDVMIDTLGILAMSGLIYLEYEHQRNFPHKSHIVKI